MEIAERLAQVLGDENAMSQIRQMAEGMDPTMLGELMGMLSGGGSGGSCGGSSGGNNPPSSSKDANVELLQAIRPFLSPKRNKRAKEAVKILKMMEMLPLLQQSGLLNNLMGGEDDD